jgi:hypothetical protein
MQVGKILAEIPQSTIPVANIQQAHNGSVNPRRHIGGVITNVTKCFLKEKLSAVGGLIIRKRYMRHNSAAPGCTYPVAKMRKKLWLFCNNRFGYYS